MTSGYRSTDHRCWFTFDNLLSARYKGRWENRAKRKRKKNFFHFFKVDTNYTITIIWKGWGGFIYQHQNIQSSTKMQIQNTFIFFFLNFLNSKISQQWFRFSFLEKKQRRDEIKNEIILKHRKRFVYIRYICTFYFWLI